MIIHSGCGGASVKSRRCGEFFRPQAYAVAGGFPGNGPVRIQVNRFQILGVFEQFAFFCQALARVFQRKRLGLPVARSAIAAAVALPDGQALRLRKELVRQRGECKFSRVVIAFCPGNAFKPTDDISEDAVFSHFFDHAFAPHTVASRFLNHLIMHNLTTAGQVEKGDARGSTGFHIVTHHVRSVWN